MASRRVQRQFAFALSVLGHAAMIAALTFAIPVSSPMRSPAPNIVPIDTVMIDESAVSQEMARLDAEQAAKERAAREEQQRLEREKAEQQQKIKEQQAELERIQEQRRQQQEAAEQEKIRIAAEQQKKAEELARLDAEKQQREAEEAERKRVAEEKRKQAEEKARQEELARQKAEEERKRQEAEEARRRAEIAAQVAEAAAAEQKARENDGLKAQWAREISNRVKQYWNRPPNVDATLECIVDVTQLPDGSVTGVTVSSCNKDDANIIRSVENAVRNASPLPRAPIPEIFERSVRIRFKPTE